MRGAYRLLCLPCGILLGWSDPLCAQDSRPAPASKPARDLPDYVPGCVMPGPPRPPILPMVEMRAWCLWLGTNGDQARRDAVRYFMRPPDPEVVRAVFAAAKDESPKEDSSDELRQWYASFLKPVLGDALFPLRGIDGTARLTELLVTGDEHTQRKALPFAAVLGRGQPATVGALIRLTRAGGDLRWRAALALSWSAGYAAAREAIPALEELLRDEDVVVRAWAAAALTRLAPRSALLAAELARLRPSRDAHVVRLVQAMDAELELAELTAASRPTK